MSDENQDKLIAYVSMGDLSIFRIGPGVARGVRVYRKTCQAVRLTGQRENLTGKTTNMVGWLTDTRRQALAS